MSNPSPSISSPRYPEDVTDLPEPRSSPQLADSLASPRTFVKHLRSPGSGLLGQLVRFGLAGGLVTLVYLTVTTVLYQVVGLPFQAALAIGFVTALMLHFTLQRLFVWMHQDGFALPFRHQVGRYLLMAGAQYGCTAASTAVLPGALGLPTEVVYLATMVVVTTTGFLLMRFVIFHADSNAVHSARTTLAKVD
jgi:putative flippase GtrA